MKRITMALAALLLAAGSFAQTTDSLYNAVADTTGRGGPDTLLVGNFIIVKQSKNRGGVYTDSTGRHRRFVVLTSPHSHDYDSNYYARHNTFTTNWMVFDLGFANIDDKTDYTAANNGDYLHKITPGEKPFTKSDLKLRTKSSNVNIWVVMQRLNIANNALNLKYGLGLEMFNFRYENDISYNKSPAYVYRDTGVNFSKDKLYAGYITAPLMVNINPWPNKKRLTVSFGASAGYLVGSHTKQKSNERGKQKTRGDFDLNQWRFAYVAELGVGPIRLYGSYSINPLHERDLKQYPYAVGIRFSSW